MQVHGHSGQAYTLDMTEETQPGPEFNDSIPDPAADYSSHNHQQQQQLPSRIGTRPPCHLCPPVTFFKV